MACNCMGCPHKVNCRCRCNECQKAVPVDVDKILSLDRADNSYPATPLRRVNLGETWVSQSHIDKAFEEIQKTYIPAQDFLGALIFLHTALGSQRPLTQAEKDYALTLTRGSSPEIRSSDTKTIPNSDSESEGC